jgi:hypothetical protein
MVELTNPDSSGWRQRLAELVEKVAEAMGMPEPWIVGLAAVLSRIGAHTVPEAVLDKVRAKAMLNTEERDAYNRIPEVGYRILRNIPRMEEVAEMIYYSQKNMNGSGFPVDSRSGDELPLGARVLRVCLEFMYTTTPKDDLGKRASEMLYNFALYDPDVVFALKKVLDGGLFAPPPEPGTGQVRQVSLAELEEGQTLETSIETVDGQVLIRAGSVLNAGQLEKVANFAMIGAVKEPFWIQS